MKGKFKKLAAAVLASAIFAGAMPSAAFAAYTAISGTKPEFKKVLVLNDASTPIPNYTFEYSIAAGTAIPAADGKLEVFAGPVVKDASNNVTAPSISSVTFGAAGDATANSTLVANKVDITKNPVVDLTGVTFNAPGVYRYVITETSAGQAGVSYDVNTSLASKGVDKKRTLDVYVEDYLDTTDSTHKLRITNYVLYDGAIDKAPNSSATNLDSNSAASNDSIITKTDDLHSAVIEATKSRGYINYCDTHSITVKKNVMGNQASVDRYFTFEITFTDLAEGTYNIDVSGASETATVAQTSFSVANTDASKTVTVKLKAGEQITILGIPHATKYTVKEEPDNYTPSVALEGDDDATKDTAVTADKFGYVDTTSGLTKNTTAIFTNELSGVIPTGVIMSVAPAVGIGALVLIAIIALVISGKKREIEEE